MNRPWEQMEGEGSAAYGLFLIFLDLGLTRSYQAVAEKTGRTEKIVKRIYHKFRWTGRALARDKYLARVELDAAKRRIEQDAVKWVQRYSELRETEFDLGKKLVARAIKMLAFPLTEEKIIDTAGPMVRDFETGELVPTRQVTIIVKPVGFKQSDVSTFADTASKLMRLAAGKETERKVLGIDGLEDKDSNLNSARDLYLRLSQEYADRPDVLEMLPRWLAESWGFEPKQIEGVVEGEIVDESLSSSVEQ